MVLTHRRHAGGQEDVPLTAFAEYKALIWVATAVYNAQTSSFINNVAEVRRSEAQATTGKSWPTPLPFHGGGESHAGWRAGHVRVAQPRRVQPG